MPSHFAAAGILYIQEITSGQLDSVSASADTTQVSLCQSIEFEYNNKLIQYLECDGTYRYLEGPVMVSGTIGQLFGFGELLAAVVGADAFSSPTYTVSKYAQFLPEFTLHLFFNTSASQQANVSITGVKFESLRQVADLKDVVKHSARFYGTLGTTNWKGGP